jgi:catechol 2,3-dioxygenase-like lactoylglutathione lyase family enzyme
MATGCSHIGLCVRDLERSQRFYEQVFGFRAAFDFHSDGDETATLLGLSPPLHLDAVYLHVDGLLLELLALDRTEPSRARVLNEPGLTHLSLFVDDIAAVLEAVTQHGGRVREHTNIGAAVFVEDPDGQAIELLPADGPFRGLRDRSVQKLTT